MRKTWMSACLLVSLAAAAADIREVVLTANVPVKLANGEMTLKKGQEVTVLKVEADTLTVRWQGQNLVVPKASTDWVARTKVPEKPQAQRPSYDKVIQGALVVATQRLTTDKSEDKVVGQQVLDVCLLLDPNNEDALFVQGLVNDGAKLERKELPDGVTGFIAVVEDAIEDTKEQTTKLLLWNLIKMVDPKNRNAQVELTKASRAGVDTGLAALLEKVQEPRTTSGTPTPQSAPTSRDPSTRPTAPKDGQPREDTQDGTTPVQARDCVAAATLVPLRKEAGWDTVTISMKAEQDLYGRKCAEAIGAHAASVVSFNIPSRMQFFTAVGRVSRHPLADQAVYAYVVRVDGKELFRSKNIKECADGEEVEIEVELPPGAKVIELVGDPLGHNGNDFACWLYPRFHRSELTMRKNRGWEPAKKPK